MGFLSRYRIKTLRFWVDLTYNISVKLDQTLVRVVISPCESYELKTMRYDNKE